MTKGKLVEKLQGVYQKQYPNGDCNDIKEIWRWLKNVLKVSIKNGEMMNV
jgi:hypothetical protein